jgi:branched-chain amino acid transport system substrate-binding protein
VAPIMALAFATSPSVAQKKYDPGASDTEIKIGNTSPYSGPVSAYGTMGKTAAAYFKMVNDQGGINGRRVTFISLDDGYSPPKTVEMTRRLVEQDEVLFVFNSIGTATNTAIHKYMNAKKVPQLFVGSGASKWQDAKNFPWTMAFPPAYHTEGELYGKHIASSKPDAKVAILFQNDDYGKDYVKGFKAGLGDKAKQIVAEASYEVTEPTIDSQIAQLKGSGADVFFNVTTPKFAAMAIRKVHDIGWKPVHYLNNHSTSIASVLTPAGLEKSVDIISTQYIKDPRDSRWTDDKGVKDYLAFMAEYYPDGDPMDWSNQFSYASTAAIAHVLKQCQDNLTRENVMKQAANIKDLQLDIFIPGIKINTGPSDFIPVESLQFVRFDGKQWVPFGGVVGK